MGEPDTALFGRVLHIPRAVFARHIQQGNSDEPPNGEYWEARITANNSSHTQFDIVLTVLDTGEGDEEELVASLKQLREWAVLNEDEDRATFAQRPVDLDKAAAAKRAATNKKRGRTAPDMFASPVKGQRYCQPPHLPASITHITFGRLVVSSPGRDLSLAFMEAHFDYDEPVYAEPPSRQPTPQKKRVAQPLDWVRNNWTCDVKCGQCASNKEALPLLAAALVTCNKSCTFDCARTVCDAARKQARSLRHDAYTQGTTLHH